MKHLHEESVENGTYNKFNHTIKVMVIISFNSS